MWQEVRSKRWPVAVSASGQRGHDLQLIDTRDGEAAFLGSRLKTGESMFALISAAVDPAM